jgi:UDP-GlcNAc:undecaprenyl-phosphate/decaprenyl-phosphate GlcNAc-1-phosphate transferase
MDFVALGTIVFLISLSLCHIITNLPDRWLLLASNNKRRTHRRPVPLLGGVGVACGLLVGGLLLPFTSLELPATVDPLSLAAAVITALVLGVLDDRYELRARWKFLGQNLVTLLLVMSLWHHQTPVHQLLGDNFLAAGLIWFWALGTLNSINLIDGMDGLASGIGLIASSFLLLLTSSTGGSALLAITAPAILGFYVLNKNPAKIFLGESGAQMVAIVLFIASMTFQSNAPAGINVLIPLFALGIPILDTLSAMIRRISRGRGLMSPDREHLHHRILRMGLSTANTVRFLHGLTLYFCAVGLFLAQGRDSGALAVSLVLSGMFINLFLMVIAEKKIATILNHLATHLLASIHQRDPSPALHKLPTETLVRCYFARLNLKPALTIMLERSPTRIEEFYRALSTSIPGTRIHFESSLSAILISDESVTKTASAAAWIQRVEKILELFEEQMKIDLQLSNRNTLRLLHGLDVPSSDESAA